MVPTPLLDFDRILASSELIAAIKPMVGKKAKSRLFGTEVRPLTESEIKILKTQGNHAEEWKNIVVHLEFKTDRIINNIFTGPCVLGVFGGKQSALRPNFALPPGIYNSVISDSEIGSGCGISAAGISNYIIKDSAIVSGVGSLSCAKTSCFGNGRSLSVGSETGGREILSLAEMTLPLAEAVGARRNDGEFLQRYERYVHAYVTGCIMDKGIVENNCVLRNTPTIENVYIGKNGIIDTALLISDSVILSSPEERAEITHGALVRNSCVQWGCRVSSMAIVDEAVLLEYSRVERHGKVSRSIIGPNTHIAEGEVTASLVGPFVGFHHQALLIAALWPEGKGNIGYGANVGSNHSGKAPDQELWCGEGTFIGLGVNIKFPADFSHSPYSIFATGVTTAPQRLEFPFSLVNTPSEQILNIPSAFNEVLPGWVLGENAYMIKRNEGKFRTRNSARRTSISAEVFRPDIIDMMISARNRLRDASDRKDFYTSAEIPGLGKNFMTDASRNKGIAAYTLFIEYYCLCGLFKQLAQTAVKKRPVNFPAIYKTVSDNVRWEHERSVLLSEGFAKRSIVDNLKRLAALEDELARSAQCSKEKDDIRGEKIIPDYAQTHLPAAQDPIIQETWETARRRKMEIETMVTKMET